VGWIELGFDLKNAKEQLNSTNNFLVGWVMDLPKSYPTFEYPY